MLVQQWFARAVAAGLIGAYDNVDAYYRYDGTCTWEIYFWNNNDDGEIRVISVQNLCEKIDDESRRYGNKITLRKNGKDLYSLEWRKPTEQDIGKMCWFYTVDFKEMIFAKLLNVVYEYYYDCNNGRTYQYCLLADHGQIAPTEADFLKVYGG